MPATSLLRWAWVAVLVGCRAAPEVPAPPPKGSLRPFGIPLDAPAAPWDGGVAELDEEEETVWVHYPAAAGSLIEARDAWRDAAVAQGWQVDWSAEGPMEHDQVSGGRYERDESAHVIVGLWRPGFYLEIGGYPGDEDGAYLNFDGGPVRFTDPAWPQDPFCPPVSRLDPEQVVSDPNATNSQRICYLSGANRLEHGPAEWTEGGQVVRSGLHDHGNQVGTWVEEWRDLNGAIYDRVTVYGKTRVQRWVDRRRKRVVVEKQWGEDYPERWTWPETGLRSHTDEGQPDVGLWIPVAEGYPIGRDETFEVLAVDPQRRSGTFRVTQAARPDDEEPCSYVTLGDLPATPTVVGLWSNGAVETFEIQREAWEPARCTSQWEASAAWDRAQAAAVATGVPFETRAGAVQAQQDGDRSMIRLNRGVIALTSERHGRLSIHRPEAALCHMAECVVGRWLGVEAGPLIWPQVGSKTNALVRLVEGWEDGDTVVLHWEASNPQRPYEGALHGFTAFQDGRVVAPGAR